MRSIIRCGGTITLLATLFAIPTVARSQATTAPHTPRAPVWPRSRSDTGVATLSLGRGDLKVNCAICRTTDQTSWAADVTVGGWINARTTLGGELGAWQLAGDEATQRVMMVSAGEPTPSGLEGALVREARPRHDELFPFDPSPCRPASA